MARVRRARETRQPARRAETPAPSGREARSRLALVRATVLSRTNGPRAEETRQPARRAETPAPSGREARSRLALVRATVLSRTNGPRARRIARIRVVVRRCAQRARLHERLRTLSVVECDVYSRLTPN